MTMTNYVIDIAIFIAGCVVGYWFHKWPVQKQKRDVEKIEEIENTNNKTNLDDENYSKDYIKLNGQTMKGG